MRLVFRKYIPSMFERRLLMLLGVAVIVALVLVGGTARLTIGELHVRLWREAEQVLSQIRYIPTIRGAILDREGRVLAVDEPGYDVAVSYAVLSGEWAFDQAYRAANQKHKAVWGELGADKREAIIARFQEPFDAQVEQLMATLAELGTDLRGQDPEQLDRRRSAILSEVQATWADVSWRHQQRRIKQLDEPISWADADTTVREQTQTHSMLSDVSPAVRSVVEGFIADARRADGLGDTQNEPFAVWQEVEVVRPKHRRYPLETILDVVVDMSTMPPDLRRDEPMLVTVEGVGLHMLGLMRDFYAEDLKNERRHPFYTTNPQGRRVVNLIGYREGDRIGSTGIEAYMEHRLRGTRGRSVLQRDTGVQERIEPKPGLDVHLTIDIALQARLQALLSEEVGLTVVQPYHLSKALRGGKQGQPLNGAAVIIEIDTAEVLAAASFPSMALRLLKEDPDQIYKNPRRLPYINRVVASRYPPGSTIKPIMLASAIAAGRHQLSTSIVCNGILDLKYPNRFRCWIFRRWFGQHGLLSASRSLEVSCNIYYYTLGQRMGVQRTVAGYARFGLGQSSDCGLFEENAGSLPQASNTTISDAINMGIGQGRIAWTPLQAAAAHATLARGGVYLSPTFIQDADRPTARQRRDLRIDSAVIRDILEGMHDVVSGPEGTGRWLDKKARIPVFNVEGVTIFGKSGSADSGRRWTDLNMNGKPDAGDEFLDEDKTDPHGWFIVWVQPKGRAAPTHVIAVVSEYAGGGTRTSGPIVNQIIHLMQEGGWL